MEEYMELPKLIGTKEVAESLKCSLATARTIMQGKGFPLVKVGKNLRVNIYSFREWTKNPEAYLQN